MITGTTKQLCTKVCLVAPVVCDNISSIGCSYCCKQCIAKGMVSLCFNYSGKNVDGGQSRILMSIYSEFQNVIFECINVKLSSVS